MATPPRPTPGNPQGADPPDQNPRGDQQRNNRDKGKQPSKEKALVQIHRDEKTNRVRIKILAPGFTGKLGLKVGYGSNYPLAQAMQDPDAKAKKYEIDVRNGMGEVEGLDSKLFQGFQSAGVEILENANTIEVWAAVPPENSGASTSAAKPATERITVSNENAEHVILCSKFVGALEICSADEKGKKAQSPVVAKTDHKVSFYNDSNGDLLQKSASTCSFTTDAEGRYSLRINFLSCGENEVRVTLSLPSSPRDKTVTLKYKQF